MLNRRGLSKYSWVWVAVTALVVAAVWFRAGGLAALLIGLSGGLSLSGSI